MVSLPQQIQLLGDNKYMTQFMHSPAIVSLPSSARKFGDDRLCGFDVLIEAKPIT
jgi:hypothetical protein